MAIWEGNLCEGTVWREEMGKVQVGRKVRSDINNISHREKKKNGKILGRYKMIQSNLDCENSGYLKTCLMFLHFAVRKSLSRKCKN